MNARPERHLATEIAASAAGAPLSAAGTRQGPSTHERVRLLLGDLASAIGCEVAQLYRPDRGGAPRLVCSFGADEPVRRAVPRRLEGTRRGGRGRGGGFVGRALTHERATVEPLQQDVDDALIVAGPGPPLTHALAAPTRGPGDLGGALIAGFTAEPRELALTLWTAEAYAAMTGIVLENPRALFGLMGAGRIDTLTGCLTYEVVIDELAREIDRAGRSGLALSCCFIDLDRFKRVNDRHGHLKGNTVLADAARVLRAGVRRGDVVGRYGGDEFVAILPQTTEPEACQLSERLRSQIAAEPIAHLEEPLTASVGVAQWTPGTTASQLLARADHALLTAKRVGGNVVIDGQRQVPRT